MLLTRGIRLLRSSAVEVFFWEELCSDSSERAIHLDGQPTACWSQTPNASGERLSEIETQVLETQSGFWEHN